MARKAKTKTKRRKPTYDQGFHDGWRAATLATRQPTIQPSWAHCDLNAIDAIGWAEAAFNG